MKVLTRVLAVACLGLTALPVADSTETQGQGATFTLRVCNKAPRQVGDAFAAVLGFTPDKQLRVSGWYKLPNSQCAEFTNVQRPGMFMYAFAGDEDVVWSDDKLRVCVSPKAFDYTWDGKTDRQCSGDEVLRGFFPIPAIAGPVTTFTLGIKQ
jgi:uncharacterized membrane protein